MGQLRVLLSVAVSTLYSACLSLRRWGLGWWLLIGRLRRVRRRCFDSRYRRLYIVSFFFLSFFSSFWHSVARDAREAREARHARDARAAHTLRNHFEIGMMPRERLQIGRMPMGDSLDVCPGSVYRSMHSCALYIVWLRGGGGQPRFILISLNRGAGARSNKLILILLLI